MGIYDSFVSIQPNLFDTELFKMKCADMTIDAPFPNEDSLEQEIRLADQSGIELLCVKVPAEWEGASCLLSRHGFRFILSSIELERRQGGGCSNLPLSIRTARAEDLGALEAISEQSFNKNTRFHLEPSFENPLATRLYVLWAKNALRDESTEVLVYEHAGLVGGFITSQEGANGIPRIGLFAVSPDFRRKGVGTALLNAVLYLRKSAEKIVVMTECMNCAALSAYVTAGFKPTKCLSVFHRLSREQGE